MQALNMYRHLRSLYRHRELLLLWTMRELSVRYKQSVLGVGWAIAQPLALMLVFSLFSLLLSLPSDGVPYPIFAYTALLAWTLLSSSVSLAIPTMVNNFNLVTKIYFPREILPLASVAASLVDFGVASLLLLLALVYFQIPITLTLLWVPAILALQLVVILGIVLPACALNVFYRDIRFIVPLALQIWLYATPIIYPVSLVPDSLRLVYAINPMVGIVDGYRRVILHGQPPSIEYLATSALIGVILVVFGYAYFKHSEEVFADLI